MRAAFWFLIVFFILCESGCARTRATRAEGSSGAPSPASSAPLPELVAPPPLGRWRLANPSEMDHVVFWLSHILIRHVDATRPDEVPFNYGDWRFKMAPATRSRADALKLAQRIAARATEAPERFAELAQQFSEDWVTKEAGGSLGGMSAVMFMIWPQFLDLVQETKVGAISRVIESGHGFHIFLRRPPPSEQSVSGEHIVIAHHEAPAIAMFARGTVPRRSRAEAQALADRVYAEARARPGAFRELTERYSEHEDAGFGGDLGRWSTRELTPIPREIETLAHLSSGEVAPPIDTVYGFQILKRTTDRERAEWAMERVELRFDPGQQVGRESQSATLALARTKLATIASDPARFSDVEKEYCCTNVLRVTEGRFSPTVEAALARLEPGQVATEPILYGGSVYLLVKRVPASRLPPTPPTRFELASPEHTEMPYFMSSRSGAFIEKALRTLVEKTRAAILLDPQRESELTRLLAGARFSDLAESERARRFEQWQSRIHELLGSADSQRYDELAQRHFDELMYQSGIFSSTGDN